MPSCSISGLPPWTRTLAQSMAFLCKATATPRIVAPRIGIRPRHEFAQFAKSVADLADDIFIRDEAILENHLGIVGQALAHLVVHAADA